MQLDQLKRREFITVLGGAAASAAWPREGGAQQNERAKHVGLLMSYIDGDPQWQPIVAAFRQRLNELGWVDGRNLRLDVRWSNLETDRVRAQAKELVSLGPDVIVATNSLTLGPLAQATSAIPLVFVNVSDPVGLGFVDSLARPSANITGFTNFEFSTGGKWLELLKDMAPRVTRVGVVFNPLTTSSSRFFLHSLEAAAPSFNVELVAPPSHDDSDVERLMTGRWCDRASRRIHVRPERKDHQSGQPPKPARGLSVPIFRRARRPVILRHGQHRNV